MRLCNNITNETNRMGLPILSRYHLNQTAKTFLKVSKMWYYVKPANTTRQTSIMNARESRDFLRACLCNT